MKMPEISLLEWQKRFGTERACEKVLVKIRWPNGFNCPRCNSTDASYIKTRKVYQCSQLPLSSIHNSRYVVSFDEFAFGEMVLGDLFGGD